MSEATVTCKECGEHVPKKKFCGECGKPLIAVPVNQPTTSHGDKASTPVQISDSASLEASKITNGQSTEVVNKQPTSSTTVNGTPSSYAEAAAVESRRSGEGSQPSNQAEKVSNNGLPGSSGMAGNGNVTETNNDGATTMNVTGGATKAANEKV